jgi:hypothetical protein
MPRALKYTVETRQCTEPWRLVWSGPGKDVAVDAARGLALETREIPGLATPFWIHPFVRVRQGQDVVVQVTPVNRQVTMS